MKNFRVVIILIIVVLFIFLISFAFGLDFKIIGSIGETYDDNINPSRENQEDDFITELRFGIEIEDEERSQGFRFFTNIYQWIYADHPELNNNYQDLELRYIRQISTNNRVSIRDIFTHYPEPRDYDYLFGSTNNRGRYFVNTFILSLNRDILDQLNSELHYENIITEFSNEDENDSRSDSLGCRLSFTINPSNVASLFYDYTRIVFDTGDINTMHEGGFEYRYNFTRQFYSIGRTGANYIETYDGRVNKSKNYYLSINNDVDENNQITLSYSKETAVNPQSIESFENWRISSSLRRGMTVRLRFSLRAFYGEGTFMPSNEINKFFGVNSSLIYEIKENIFGSLAYQYTKSRTERPALVDSEYDRNQITLLLRAEF